MTRELAEQQLTEYLYDGLASEIFAADRARFICNTIGRYAQEINARGYGGFFGQVQVEYSNLQTLAIVKMFDRPDRRHPVRSIPTILDTIEQFAHLWALPQRKSLEQALISGGGSLLRVESLNDEELSLAIVALFRSTTPNGKGNDQLSVTLQKLRQSRNKIVAHNESLPVTERESTSWGEAEALVHFAKRFMVTLVPGFLGVVTTDAYGAYTNFGKTPDIPSQALERLLMDLGITAGISP